MNAGYCASSNPLAVRDGAIIPPSRNTLFLADGKTQFFRGVTLQNAVTGGRVMFNSPTGYMSLGTAAGLGIGSIVGLVAKAVGIIGTGTLYVNGVSRAINASTALQILLHRINSYSGAGTGPYIAGLSQMSAPTIAEHSTNTSTTNSGTTSITVHFVRSATGGRGKKSAPSNVLVVNGKTVRLTIAGGDLTTASTNGYDRIGVSVTVWGFGATGAHTEYTEIAISSLTTVDGVANSYELQWSSAELSGKPLAPLDDEPPPAAVFAAAIEDVSAVIGCFGDATSGVTATTPGTAIAVSLPVYIESFPPDNLLFLQSPPTGVLSRASDGFCFVARADGLDALTYTGGSPALSLQNVWATTGFAAQHNMFLGEGGRLYGFSNGKRGIVRLGEKGEPDTEFAKDVAEEVSSWLPFNVVGGWDNDHQMCVFGHEKTLLCFNSQSGLWSSPVDLSPYLATNEVICACVTVDGGLLIAVRDTVAIVNPIKLFSFNSGTGSLAEVYLAWRFSPAQADEIFQVDASVRADNTANSVTVKVFKNGSAVSQSTKTLTLPATGQQHLKSQRINVHGAKSHSIYYSQQATGGANAGIDLVVVRGERSDVVI